MRPCRHVRAKPKWQVHMLLLGRRANTHVHPSPCRSPRNAIGLANVTELFVIGGFAPIFRGFFSKGSLKHHHASHWFVTISFTINLIYRSFSHFSRKDRLKQSLTGPILTKQEGRLKSKTALNLKWSVDRKWELACAPRGNKLVKFRANRHPMPLLVRSPSKACTFVC